MRNFDAIYLGAIGHPDVKPGILENGILLKLRFDARPLHQPATREALSRAWRLRSANKRPEDIDFVVVRENTEDLYIGAGGFFKKGTPDEVAMQEMITRARASSGASATRSTTPGSGTGRRRSPSARKTNVLTYAHDLWDRAFDEVAARVPRHQDRLRPRRRDHACGW